MTPTDLITANETAQRLQVAVGTLKRWRRCHVGPPWCRIGQKSIRYPLALLEEWLDSRRVTVPPETRGHSEGTDDLKGLTGIIPGQAVDPRPQVRRWNFLANIRPEGG
jgi:predicted DNA-binding transcriptional regulator AlpA